jgi:hypothetical protein
MMGSPSCMVIAKLLDSHQDNHAIIMSSGLMTFIVKEMNNLLEIVLIPHMETITVILNMNVSPYFVKEEVHEVLMW